MTVKPINIEIVTNYISDIERIVEAVRKLRKSNPDEILDIAIRVENADIYKTVVKPGIKICLV
nr:MAG TPA: hypothetical protein [Caudoviricetes sp.]